MEIGRLVPQVFGDRYFIEIQNNGLEIQRIAMEGAVEVADRMGLPLVATSDAHYVHREDAEAQDVLLCINTGKFRTDTNRMRMETQPVLSPQPGGDVRASSRPRRGRATQPGDRRQRRHRARTGQAALSRLHAARREDRPRIICASCASTGLKERYADDPERMRRRRNLSAEVIDRLEHELGVINKLGFANYFLIVWDFVRFARAAGHPGHGPRLGRRLAGRLRACI